MMLQTLAADNRALMISRWNLLVAAAMLTAITAAVTAGLALLPPPESEIIAFATSLTGRTPAQRHNAEMSARALDGAVIKPGAVLSFNRAVKSWSHDQGYVKAPVSYDGELIPAFGGGVCQTSTTLYNAALLAGLSIVERHHHVFAPHYVPPGRDAAVAYPSIDLRLRNPYPFALRVHAMASGSRLEVSFWGSGRPKDQVAITPRVLSITSPEHLVRSAGSREGLYHRNAGSIGCRVVTYRFFTNKDRLVWRERLSDDSYPAMDRVVTVPE